MIINYKTFNNIYIEMYIYYCTHKLIKKTSYILHKKLKKTDKINIIINYPNAIEFIINPSNLIRKIAIQQFTKQNMSIYLTKNSTFL
jgi:hypothetical protein